MSRTFTPSERRAIHAAAQGGTSVRAVAKRFGVREKRIREILAEPVQEVVAPAPYAEGYRTGVQNVYDCGGSATLFSRRDISWRKK